jgi:hypothetical protein
MPVVTRSKAHSQVETKSSPKKTVELVVETHKPRVEASKLEITPTGSCITTTISTGSEKKTEVYSETVKKVTFKKSGEKCGLYSFQTSWLRQIYIDDCRKTELNVEPDYVYYEYNEETGVYRIPLDDNFHNTIASIYYDDEIYLVPMEEMYVVILDTTYSDKPVWYMQFKASNEFDGEEVEKLKYPTLIGETLIGHFIHSSIEWNNAVTMSLADYSQQYYMALLIYFWSQGIYVNACYNSDKFYFEFQNILLSEL